MRASTSRALIALALLAAAPTPADVNLGGDLGVSMTRNDQWGADTHLDSTAWWFNGSLRLAASFFSPGTLDVGASASYLGYRAVGGQASDAFNYQLRLNALQRTPVSISLAADRATVNFTADTNTGRVGTTRSDGFAGTVTLTTADYPFLSATVRNSSTVNRPIGSAEVKSDVTTLYAQASQSLEALNYTLSYDTSWSSGDFAETNYQQHGVLLRAQAQLTTNVTAQVSATYNLREPTLTSPLNPRMDSQSVAAWVQFAPTGDFSGGAGYTYADSLFDAPGSPIRQSISHSVSAYALRRLSEAFAVDLNLSASSGESVVGAVSRRATGEGLGAGLSWARQLDLYAAQASVAGTVGLLQPDGAPSTSAWGVNGTFNLSRPIDTWSGTAGLAAGYDENTGASAGHRTRLYGSLGASGSPMGWYFTSLLTGGYARSESPSFGKNNQANLRLDASANRNGYNLGLNAGVTDDLAEVLVPGAPPASNLVPVDFNTQTRFVTAIGVVPAIPRLFLTLVARYLSVAQPGRATAWESALSVSATYHLGAFNFSLYDQISVNGTDATSSGTQNVLFLSVSRSFGR